MRKAVIGHLILSNTSRDFLIPKVQHCGVRLCPI